MQPGSAAEKEHEKPLELEAGAEKIALKSMLKKERKKAEKKKRLAAAKNSESHQSVPAALPPKTTVSFEEDTPT